MQRIFILLINQHKIRIGLSKLVVENDANNLILEQKEPQNCKVVH